MKKLSAILAAVLVLALALSMLPVGAAAASETLTFDFSSLTKKGEEITSGALDLFQDATSGTGLTAVALTKVYNGNGTGGAFENTAGLLKCGTSKADAKLELTFDKNVTKVQLFCHGWKNAGYDKMSVNGSTAQDIPCNNVMTDSLTFDLSAASEKVTIDVDGRAFIFKIVVTLGDAASGGGATPNPNPNPDTTNELPKTPGGIVDAIFSLEQGEALADKYDYEDDITMVGTVAGSATWSDDYNNGEVTIKVLDSEGKEKNLLAFRFKAGSIGVDQIKAIENGDILTFTGKEFKNYNGTFEICYATLIKIEKASVALPKLPTETSDILDAIFALKTSETLNAYYEYESFTLSGTVVGANEWSADYNNGEVTIKIDGSDKEILAWRYGAGEIADDVIQGLAEGDKLTFTVKGVKNYNGTYEMEYPTLTSVVKAGSSVTPPASSTPAPKPTGDNTNIIGMTIVMVLAVTAVAALVIGNKKRSV